MLATSQRLRKTVDIEKVYRRGRYGGLKQLQAKAYHSGLASSRVAIVVSRKVAKKAIVRNKIKRRLSAQLRELWETIIPGYDIVISVREDTSKLSVAELKHQINEALARAGCLKTPVKT